MPRPNLVTAIKTNTQLITGTNTWTPITGLSANLIVGSTTARVRVNVTVAGYSTNAGYVRVARNGTAVGVGDAAGSRASATMGNYYHPTAASGGMTYSSCFIDTSPGTTTLTYAVQGWEGNSGQFQINYTGDDSDDGGRGRLMSSIVVEEIFD